MDDLFRKWRVDLFSTHEWELDIHASPTAGALSGVWLKPRPDAPFGAYMKPTTYACSFPAAAKEKIAADLAYDLGVVVAPVLLYDSDFKFGAVQRECCVSLRTHAETPPWGFLWSSVLASSPMAAALRGAAAERVSSLATFDLWIDNRDRKNTGNVIYGEDREFPSRSGFVGLDHSLSMGIEDSWQGGDWKVMTAVPFPEELRPVLDKSVMLRVAERIADLPDDTVTRCVTRIPGTYLDHERRNVLTAGLLGRKNLVKAFVLQHL
jgi:hypothetical protein